MSADKFFRFSRAQPHADPHFRFPTGLLTDAEPWKPVAERFEPMYVAVYGAGGSGGEGVSTACAREPVAFTQHGTSMIPNGWGR